MTTDPHNPATTGYHGNDATTTPDTNSAAHDWANQNGTIEVRIEFVLIDGPEGARLEALQAEAVKRVLRALYRATTATSKGDLR